MFSNELEFLAEEWARLSVERAQPLGLPNALLAREFLVRGMCMLTNKPAQEIREVIDSEMLRSHFLSGEAAIRGVLS